MRLVEETFLAAGCSTEPNSLDVHSGRFLIYGAGKNVLVSEVAEEGRSRPCKTIALPFVDADIELENNKASIHAVRWLALRGFVGALVASGSGQVRIYGCSDDNVMDSSAWRLLKSIPLDSSVSRLSFYTDTECNSNDSRLFITASTSKGTLYAWTEQLAGLHRASNDQVSVPDSMSFSGKKITAVQCVPAPGCLRCGDRNVLVFVALSDSTIRIVGTDTGNLTELLSLSGHQNWVTAMDMGLGLDSGDEAVLIASASLDRTVRVWKLSQQLQNQVQSVSRLQELVPPCNTFLLNGQAFKAELDAVVLGHENAVYACKFTGQASSEDRSVRRFGLLTGAADRLVIMWQQGGVGTEAWQSWARLGETSASSGLASIGLEHSLAFHGVVEVSGGKTVAASMSTGAIVFWTRTEEAESVGWTSTSVPPITGHTGPVEACIWAPEKNAEDVMASPSKTAFTLPNFLLTASQDQTTRVFASPQDIDGSASWSEIARPQVHGYDLKCAAWLRPAEQPLAIELLTGADEKVLRVFRSPGVFVNGLLRGSIQGDNDSDDRDCVPRRILKEAMSALPLPASLPALGLSNKVIEAPAGIASNDLLLGSSLSEGELSRGTLWPETDKLYGHNHELTAVAIDGTGCWAASSARAHLAVDAAIHFWSRREGKWHSVGSANVHNLTVTRLVFANHKKRGLLLLAVSRDRHWSLLRQCQNDANPQFELWKRHEGHTRIIWAAAWLTSADDAFGFVTGSRDCTVKTWSLSDGEPVLCSVLNVSCGVTALDVFLGRWLAVADERGGLQLFSCIHTENALSWGPLGERMQLCAGPIRDVRWNRDAAGTMLLAAVSEDHTLRILRIHDRDLSNQCL